MNWEAIGAIGELLGAMAVVISLVYVASQVKSGTQALKTTTRDSAFHSLPRRVLVPCSFRASAIVANGSLGGIQCGNLDTYSSSPGSGHLERTRP